jgi:hypothetical protein
MEALRITLIGFLYGRPMKSFPKVDEMHPIGFRTYVWYNEIIW